MNATSPAAKQSPRKLLEELERRVSRLEDDLRTEQVGRREHEMRLMELEAKPRRV